ncbi:hypothetical protein SAMN06265355_112226 [Actinomadura mexicana]|uniref:Uncharacterized protein n=2 Tax=Actinomadura mexicana TaxID=134959 RepID=A0A239CI58_9ACTN|nr:hypothetical protein SAMN06265355_112226 [Actinomadura mexicana]
MKFMRLSAAAAREVAIAADVDPSDAEVLDGLDQYSRDPAVTAMAAGATGEEAVDAIRRGVDMGRYSREVGYNRPHEEAIRRSGPLA